MSKQNRRIVHIDLSRPEQITRPKAGKGKQRNEHRKKAPEIEEAAE